MHNRAGKLFLLNVLLGLFCTIAVTQERPGGASSDGKDDPKLVTRISLAGGSAELGSSVIVPIYFTPAQGANVGHIKLQIKFVSVNLKFQKLDPGVDLPNVELKSDVTPGKTDKGLEFSTVTVLASLTPNASKGIPEGLLGYLNLTIDKKGKPAIINLQASAEATELGSNKPLKNVRASGTEIEVTEEGAEPPAVTCFFFSH